MTVQQLVTKLTQNCPPNCMDKVVAVEEFGRLGDLKNVRYTHKDGRMVLELVIDCDGGAS